MAIIKGNCLRIPYKIYKARLVPKFVEQLPEGRKLSLAQEIRVRANTLGCTNLAALQRALKCLTGEDK